MANHISVVIPQDSRTYIHWDADGVETVPPSEAKDIPAVVEELRNIQRAYFDKTGRCYSGLHATTTHEVVKGTFVVPSHLPAHLRQSDLFANEGVYPVACRYYTSEQSAPGRDHDDDYVVSCTIPTLEQYNNYYDPMLVVHHTMLTARTISRRAGPSVAST
jgi:hypothetical protein